MHHKKSVLHASLVVSLVGVVFPVFGLLAKSPVNRGEAQTGFMLPASAQQVEDDVYFLGLKQDPASNRFVEGYAFVHRRDESVRGQGARQGGPRACYAYLARGAKWKTLEPWIMNPSNDAGLATGSVFALESDGIAKWEDASDGVVGSGPGFAILGAGSTTGDILVADATAPDGLNEVYFADIASSGTIGVTTVWGFFSGPASQRELVEWDQVYNDVDFAWSLTGDPGTMDFDNIATHEIGHAVGMGHPSGSCTEETMYAYADFGEIKKRDLNTGDITGIDLLY